MQTPPSAPQSYPPPGNYAPPPAAPQKQSKTLLYVIIGVVVLCLGCVAVTGILFALGIAKLPAALEAVSTELPALEQVITQVVPAATEAPQGPATFPSPYVNDVILSESVTEGDMAPVNPTSVFNSSSVIHAVVDIEDAPVDTVFKSMWYVEDVGDAAAPDSFISETELTTDGTRYLDFNLTPTSGWPPGIYRVEIFVNGALHEVLFYTVQ